MAQSPKSRTGFRSAHAKRAGIFGARFFRRARRHSSTAGATPAATVASVMLDQKGAEL